MIDVLLGVKMQRLGWMRRWVGCVACLLLWCAVPAWVQAQDSVRIRIREVVTGLPEGPLDRMAVKSFKGLRDSAAILPARTALAARMAQRGWAEFSIDTFALAGQRLTLQSYLGRNYRVAALQLDGLNELSYQRAGFGRWVARRRPLDWLALRTALLGTLDEYQDVGYPFARFDSLALTYRTAGDTVYADIRYRFLPGKLVTLDTIIVEGDIRERREFVERFTGLYPGDAFDQSQIDNAQRILNGSVYFRNARKPVVEFTSEDKARVTLRMESRKSGKFDLLLGILPPRDATSKLQFTGLVDLQLVSPLFRAGELIQFRFDKLVGASQKLHLQYAQPYIFGSPIRIQGELDLLKQDTTFLTRFGKYAAGYAFNPNLSVRVYYKGKTSTLISTKAYELDTTVRPPVLDAKDQTYGLGFEFENLDYRLNPRKGWHITADVGIGRKQIRPNPRLTEQLYAGLEMRLPKREADFQAEWYRAWSKRMVLRLANRTYWLDQSQYFQNDLLQVGGSRSIRGFNENQFFANFMTFFTLENRFILEENSYLFVFSDYAYLENVTGTERILRPFGVGLGMTYETKAGMLSLTYAAGQAGTQSFQPSRGRIHIGLINQF
jgi:outer membrane protein assembly factor BamA